MEGEEQLSSQTRAHVISTSMTLANSGKGSLSVAEYLANMQRHGNDMATAGNPLDDEDLVQYIPNLPDWMKTTIQWSILFWPDLKPFQ
jgi:hypothetical protein